MEVLPDFNLIRPASVEDAIKAGVKNSSCRWLGGGTDLLVNLRRGIGDAPQTLVDVRGIEELWALKAGAESLIIGASVTLAALAQHPDVIKHYPGVAQAAQSIAGPTHRQMATVGGNLCLDTRCIFYNQSEWWRSANNYCLKYGGTVCHVAPKSDVCFATFSGDLAPALMVLDAVAEVVGPDGVRDLPVKELYTGDGQTYLALRPGEMVTHVSISGMSGRCSAYEKMRVRRSIEFPLAGVAVAIGREGHTLTSLKIAVTGTNPRPVLLEGTDDLCGVALDDRFTARLDELVRDQTMSMKTTFTAGHYRRRVAGILVRRVTDQLFNNGNAD